MASEYIEFLERPSESGKTKIITVIAKMSQMELGEIKWHASWRKYCYFPKVDTLYDANCLNIITEKIAREMHLHAQR